MGMFSKIIQILCSCYLLNLIVGVVDDVLIVLILRINRQFLFSEKERENGNLVNKTQEEKQRRVENYFKQTSQNWAALENALFWTISRVAILFFNSDMSERNWGGKSDTGIPLSISRHCNVLKTTKHTFLFCKVMKTVTCIGVIQRNLLH